MANKIASRSFWNSAAERAIKTVAQTTLAVTGTGIVGLFDIDWLRLASVSLMAGLVSVLTSLASIDTDGRPNNLRRS